MTKKLVFLGSLVAILITVFANLQSVKAQASLDYYKGLFDSWGISTDTLPQKNTKLETPATKKDLQTLLQILEGNDTEQKLTEEGVINTNKEGRYLLILESQLRTTPQIRDEILGYQNVILVCDSLDCAPSSLNFADQNPSESSVSDTVLQIVRPTNVGGINYYTLPQFLLITPRYQENLGDYFSALSQARASADVSDAKEATDTTARELLKSFRDSPVFESTVYALILLLFIVALNKPIITLISRPQRLLEQSLYVSQTHRAINALTENSGIILFIFLVLVIFYIPILYTLSIKASLLGDPAYPIKYLSTTLNPLNIPNYLTAQNLFRIGLLFYNYALALFGIFLLIPRLEKVFTGSAKKITGVTFRTAFLKWLIPSIVALDVVLLAFVGLKSLVGFLSLSVMLLLISLVYLRNRRIEYPNLFSNKERRLVILILSIVLSLNIFYSLLQRSRPIKYTYEPLISVNDGVIDLPYSRQREENVLFNPYYYNGNSKVYVDGYLIYSPNTERVVNKSLSKFNDIGSFTVVSRKSGNVFETLLKNPGLVNYTTSADFSPLFIPGGTLSNAPNSPGIKMRLTFNCSFAPSHTVIKLEAMTLNKLAQSDSVDPSIFIDPVSAKSAEIMDFPGCKTEVGTEAFEVPLDLYTIPQEFSILRIRGMDERYLTDLKIFVEGKESPVKFINKDVLNESQYKILYASPNPTKDITNYSTDVKGEFLVNTQTNGQEFDLSTPINKLIKAGVLHNPFIIWTDKPYEILQKI